MKTLIIMLLTIITYVIMLEGIVITDYQKETNHLLTEMHQQNGIIICHHRNAPDETAFWSCVNDNQD